MAHLRKWLPHIKSDQISIFNAPLWPVLPVQGPNWIHEILCRLVSWTKSSLKWKNRVFFFFFSQMLMLRNREGLWAFFFFFNLLNKSTREPSTWATSSTWMREKKKKKLTFQFGGFYWLLRKTGCFHCQRSPGCFWLGISVKSALQTSAITQAVYSGESPHMESIIERHPGWWCLV